MNQPDPETVRGLRRVIEDYLASLREAKLKELQPNDPKFEGLHAQYERHAWLSNAARLVADIQAATHVLKATHSSARRDKNTINRTNIFKKPCDISECDLVCSKCLGSNFICDVAVDNAASLGMLKFLYIEYKKLSFIDWLQKDKLSSMYAMSDNVQLSEHWANSFLTFIQKPEKFASHTLAKQLYWIVGDDPLDDAQFHLLAPLYASSLAHSVYTIIQEHQFGGEAKTAREAKKQNVFCEHILHEYPNVAVQKMGGSKPQNISQLNSERNGVNSLLPSCPPLWHSLPIKPLHGVASVFERFGRQKDIRILTRELRTFLESNPDSNQATRDRRDDLLDRILVKLLQYVENFRALPPGWSADARCRLVEAEQCWLDPKRAVHDSEFAATWLRLDWADEVRRRFGNWLNAMLGGKLPLGDIEHEYWADFFDDSEWRRQVKAAHRDLEKEVNHV